VSLMRPTPALCHSADGRPAAPCNRGRAEAGGAIGRLQASHTPNVFRSMRSRASSIAPQTTGRLAQAYSSSAFRLADIHFHVVACNSDREALHTPRCRRAEDGACLDGVLSAVPGASNCHRATQKLRLRNHLHRPPPSSGFLAALHLLACCREPLTLRVKRGGRQRAA
jgi:hypothetical protein